MIITVLKSEIGERLDIFLAKKLPEYSRSYFSNLIKSGDIQINGKKTKSSHKTESEDRIEIDFVEKTAGLSLKPLELPLDIIYEDNNVIVINKPAGLVVHPAAGNPDNTLINALVAHFPAIKDATVNNTDISKIRPGLVHRLDKDTSGVLIVAKNARAMVSLAKQIKDRVVKKEYLAFCYSWPKNESGQLVNFIARNPKNRKVMAEVGKEKGREAISNFKVIKYFQFDKTKLSLIQFNIETGRTHQIRLQSKIAGFPVLGDQAYTTKESAELSKKLKLNRQMLHAHKLKIQIFNRTEQQEFVAPLPPDFIALEKKLREI